MHQFHKERARNCIGLEARPILERGVFTVGYAGLGNGKQQVLDVIEFSGLDLVCVDGMEYLYLVWDCKIPVLYVK